jgi:hypothetical protein
MPINFGGITVRRVRKEVNLNVKLPVLLTDNERISIIIKTRLLNFNVVVCIPETKYPVVRNNFLKRGYRERTIKRSSK